MSTPVGWFCNRGEYTPRLPTRKRSEHTTHAHINRAPRHAKYSCDKQREKRKQAKTFYNCTFAPICAISKNLFLMFKNNNTLIIKSLFNKQ